MNFLVTALLESSVKIAEKQGNWGDVSRKEFLMLIKEALQKKAISDETAFNLTIRAMAIPAE